MRDEAAGGDLSEWHHLRYIIPPNRDVAFLNGHTAWLLSWSSISPRTTRAHQAPVAPLRPRSGQRLPPPDRDQHEFPICMVPSGTGTTAGRHDWRQRYHEWDGMVMAQNPTPESAGAPQRHRRRPRER